MAKSIAKQPTRWRTLSGRAAFTAALTLLAAFSGQSCVFDDSATVECDNNDLRCPTGFSCALAQNVCIEDGCGNGIAEFANGETCDDGNIIDNDGCSADCSLENCGDGLLQVGEVCDDGNEVSGDGCSADCISTEICGNSIVDVGEICDDGNTTSGDGCRGDCTGFEMCGNGTVDTGEQCDNGGTDDPLCDADCTFVACGDGRVNSPAGEACDPDMGANTDSSTCDADCSTVVCGDNYTNTAANEMCDTGGDSVSCDNDCTPATCGDNYVNNAAGETCDDGNGDLTDDCPDGASGSCVVATCGDGFVRAGVELCDDGGESAACDNDCTPSACGDMNVNNTAGETCDDGNSDNSDECPDGAGGTCVVATCGDGFIYVGMEDCDDSGESATCDDDCTVVDCGDGNINGSAGEMCDDNNNNDNDGCPSGILGTCQDAFCGDSIRRNGVEDCDTGGDSVMCDGDCTFPLCGDGYTNTMANEQCDDGDDGDNTNACIDGCVAATCGDGHVWAGMEECDRNGEHNLCDDDCTAPMCGDGNHNAAAGEACDDGNASDNDGCLNDCTLNVCGDGIVNTGVEQCDTSGNSPTCDSNCTVAACGDGFYNSQAETCDDTSAMGQDGGCNPSFPNCSANCMTCT